MSKKIVLVGSLDTKEKEFLYVKEIIEESGVETLLINTGVYESSSFGDIFNEEVAKAGGSTVDELRQKNDRGYAVAVMTNGVASIVKKLVDDVQVAGVFGMGGTAGTTVGAAAMRSVPVGIPKLIVSTVASGNTRPYVGEKDIMMMYSIVDIAGINSLSARILRNAANALSGMVKGNSVAIVDDGKPMIGATMFGVTTPCVNRTREILEKNGFDVLVFHATGAGGDAMENLINDGFIQGVVDITTTELADGLVGGIFSSGKNRLEVAGAKGIPQVVSVGALDMVNFGPPETVPEKFKDRKFYQHNPTTTLMRTTVEENFILGGTLARKLNKSASPTVLVFPKGGVSLLDKSGQPFEGIEERQALYNGIKENLKPHITLLEVEEDINNPSVASLIAYQLLELLSTKIGGVENATF
ncbi:Tm-1-like ATP-binding domain-containing protein [Neobacillus novalis]|uniref:Tm-1-like ATP-binding domain-containing protein n=1 Tax=Neobacillus novalis TaxID=220687 RepID=A0AA95MJ14_9BACI|nr:Tm-1-like ATP-binding domain-containing protein [Neobacillus novalis]WHY84017.1 Tm-1-like ATP-binding domain-containing protein [Neobacillus novalis]